MVLEKKGEEKHCADSSAGGIPPALGSHPTAPCAESLIAPISGSAGQGSEASGRCPRAEPQPQEEGQQGTRDGPGASNNSPGQLCLPTPAVGLAPRWRQDGHSTPHLALLSRPDLRAWGSDLIVRLRNKLASRCPVLGGWCQFIAQALSPPAYGSTALEHP